MQRGIIVIMNPQQTELWKNNKIIKNYGTISIPRFPEAKSFCDRCELHEQAHHVGIATEWFAGMWGTLITRAEGNLPTILIIGQNPGWHEDKAGKPFVGRSGDVLKKSYLEGIQLSKRANLWLSNGVRCHTTNNQVPKPKHYRECNQHLIEDLKILIPDLVLTLGAPATTSFYKNILGITKISLKKSFTMNGNLYTPDDHKLGYDFQFNMFSTYHPAAVMRNGNLINSVHSHMQLISDCIDDTMASPSTPEIIPTRSPNES